MEYEALARRVAGRGRIRFEGHIAHKDVPAMLGRFDVYVAVSRDDSESFGVAVIEASACGVPVVVSDAGGLPEVVDHGTTGFVIRRDAPLELARMLCKLATDEALRMRLGAAGRLRVRKDYEWRGCVDRMIEIYRELTPPRSDLPVRTHETAPGCTVGIPRMSRRIASSSL